MVRVEKCTDLRERKTAWIDSLVIFKFRNELLLGRFVCKKFHSQRLNEYCLFSPYFKDFKQRKKEVLKITSLFFLKVFKCEPKNKKRDTCHINRNSTYYYPTQQST